METFAADVWEHAKGLRGVVERASEAAPIPALFVGRIELLHFHGTTMDLRLPPPLVAVETAKGGARRHHLLHAALDGWVEVDIRAASDLDRAKDLVAKAHQSAVLLART
ncbi:MAG TPA: luciferase family protein [Thermoplasmata archaeon]|nr:luciferase family protein [Thermoplasmata archaeon]